jgi:hypothetical protein
MLRPVGPPVFSSGRQAAPRQNVVATVKPRRVPALGVIIGSSRTRFQRSCGNRAPNRAPVPKPTAPADQRRFLRVGPIRLVVQAGDRQADQRAASPDQDPAPERTHAPRGDAPAELEALYQCTGDCQRPRLSVTAR